MTFCRTYHLRFVISFFILFWGVHPLFAQNYTPASYIEAFKDKAVRHMEAHGCPASVILAIAMHESANGNSKVAQHLNNHFGIKGKNNSTTIRSAYKGYEDVSASYHDFIDWLKRRKTTRQLFETHGMHEYEQWVKGIARSGYAANPTWAGKILHIIQRYDLHQYDRYPDGALADEDVVTAADNEVRTYTVKKGDTLWVIARNHRTTVKAIQERNNLKGSKLRIGQQLIME